MKGVKIYTCRKIRRDVEEQLEENRYQPPPPMSPRDEDGYKIRVIKSWRWLMQKHLLTDHASQIMHILSRIDEMQHRLIREKEERRKLLEMMKRTKQAEAQEPVKKSKGQKPCIRPGNKGRPLSPSIRNPKGGWKLSILDCPHVWERLIRNRENASAAWITCLDCGSRWGRIHGSTTSWTVLVYPRK